MPERPRDWRHVLMAVSAVFSALRTEGSEQFDELCKLDDRVGYVGHNVGQGFHLIAPHFTRMLAFWTRMELWMATSWILEL